MNKNSSRSLAIIERRNLEQRYTVRTEFNSNIHYDAAKIIFELSEDFWYDNEGFVDYCNKDTKNRSIERFSDYCKFMAKNKFSEINNFVRNKSFETLEEFLHENKIGEAINSYYLDGEEITNTEYIEDLNSRFNYYGESIYFYDKKMDKDLEIVVLEG